jgi:hypothetical protein
MGIEGRQTLQGTVLCEMLGVTIGTSILYGFFSVIYRRNDNECYLICLDEVLEKMLSINSLECQY